MYILSLAVLKGVASVRAIITDTGIYCHQRQFMQTAIYADDNSCNMYCCRQQFMQATIYAVTRRKCVITVGVIMSIIHTAIAVYYCVFDIYMIQNDLLWLLELYPTEV